MNLPTATSKETPKEIDPRLKYLSYSSKQSLDSCARKFQLTKLHVQGNSIEDDNSRITLAFGHSVGLGIQLVFEGLPEDEIIWRMFLTWELPLMADSTKHKKNFFLAVVAVQKLYYMRQQGFLDEYDLMYYEGKSSSELSFLIEFDEGFRDRGFIDLILEHKVTKEVLVIECKTDSSKIPIHEAKYANSNQALGYSIVLDHIRPGLSSYKVLYLIYKTEALEFIVFQFVKDAKAKAEWIASTMLSIAKIKLYEEYSNYPKNGNACMAWGRVCQFYGICNLSDKFLIKPISREDQLKLEQEDNEKFFIKTKVQDIIDTQINKISKITT